IDTAKEVVEQFNQEHPNIQVSYQSNAWSAWPQVFTTAVGSGTAPDISTGGGYQAVQFYPDGAILELDDVAAEFKPEDFVPGHLEALKYNGHYIALPWGFAIRIPYYRKDLFEAAGVTPPTNWDELRTVLNTLTTGDQYGIAFAGNHPLGWQQLFSFMFNNGGGLFAESGELDVLNDRNVEALTFVSDLIKDGVVHPGSAGFSDADTVKAFANGSVAMIVFTPGTEDRVPTVKDQVELLAPMTGPHGDQGTLAFGNNLMVYSQTEYPEETKTFLKWWSANSLPIFSEGHSSNLPARMSIVETFFQDNVINQRILDEWVPISHLFNYKAPGIFPALADIDGGGMLNTMATDILQGKDVVEVLQKLETTLSSLKTLQQ
ncbi:MAG: sugar ABC transporter substrate-binding protein, partial [Anaerolineae bacterium]|nr:sugar ABC transporter substrate-binding protein [Anaerolineae bacterium]